MVAYDDGEQPTMTRRMEPSATDALKGEQDTTSGRLGAGDAEPYSGIERRVNPHRDDERADWETIALRRIARRVELMPSASGPSRSTPVDHGWEEAAVNALRRRLGELKSG